MEVSNHRRVVELVDAALDLEPAERGAFLERECPDPELREEVESLLDEADFDEFATLDANFLARPAALEMALGSGSDGLPLGDAGSVEEEAPDSIGPYRVLEELGRGGMGTVYLAEQSEPIERRVAVKVLRGFAADREGRRFAAECRALARLKHPNIAAVYDAGVTEDGRAFVAMEWVEGAHLTRWCDEHRLTLNERIELFLGICAGVGHAHQKGLVHRDLKPSNVLVAEVDGQATAKVIDFGIARSLEDTDVAKTVALTAEQSADIPAELEQSRSLLMGSPVYMSPEAARLGDRSDVDTRTDVYSLGVLLFELLVGVLPLDLRGLGIGAMLKQVRDTDAPSASARWAELDEEQRARIADLRFVRVGMLKSSLRGDLDAILARATARRRDERYDSVADLATDLRNYLQYRPVTARESSVAYNLSRFVRRHLGSVVAVVAVIGVLVIGVMARTQEARRANQEAERARQALSQAEQLSDFLIGLFEISDPDRRFNEPGSVDELLARAEESMDEELADQPLARARFMQTLGRIAMSRTDLDRAAMLYEQALALREEHQAADHPDLITTIGSLGVVYRRQGRDEEAEAAALRAVDLIESSDEPNPALLSANLTWLANLHFNQRRLEEAAAGHARALDIRRRDLPDDVGALGESLNNLGVAYRDIGRYSESRSLLQEAEALFMESLGPNHPVTLGCRFNLAGIEEKLGHWQEAERSLQHVQAAWEEIYGPNHYRSLMAVRALASFWYRWSRFDEAIDSLRSKLEALEAQEEGLPVEIARYYSVLGLAFLARGDLDAAQQAYQTSLDMNIELVGEDHRTSLGVMAKLALVSWKRGRDGEKVITELEDLLVRRIEMLGEEHLGIAWMRYDLGEILLARGRLEEAEQMFRQALAVHEAASEIPSARAGRDLLGLARVRRDQGRRAEALEFFAQADAIFQQFLPEGHPDREAAREEKQALETT